MWCENGTLVKWDRVGIDINVMPCRSWHCPGCNAMRKRQLTDWFASGKPTKFLTLTWRASRPETPEEARAIMGPAVKLLFARWKRRIGDAELEYGNVVERTKRGYPHFHFLLRTGWIDAKWLSKTWASLIDAPVIKIERIKNLKDLARYLAKYLSKDPQKIGTGKRYWFSQNYRPKEEEERAAARRRFVYKWHRETLQQTVAIYARKGLIGMPISPRRYVYYEASAP